MPVPTGFASQYTPPVRCVFAGLQASCARSLRTCHVLRSIFPGLSLLCISSPRRRCSSVLSGRDNLDLTACCRRRSTCCSLALQTAPASPNAPAHCLWHGGSCSPPQRRGSVSGGRSLQSVVLHNKEALCETADCRLRPPDTEPLCCGGLQDSPCHRQCAAHSGWQQCSRWCAFLR